LRIKISFCGPRISISRIFIVAALLLLSFFGVSAASGGSTAFQAIPLFEIDCASGAAAASGKPSSPAAKDEVISMYADHDSPVSFSVFEKLDLVLVLDPGRESVRRFDMKGKFLGEVKLPFKENAVDFAWFPNTKAAFFAFEDSGDVGFMEADLAAGNRISSHKMFDIPAISGEKTIKDFAVHKIWPSMTHATSENFIILNAAMGADTDRAFIYKNGSLKRSAWLPKEFTGCAAFQGRPAAVGVEVRDGAAVMISYDLLRGDLDWVPLLKELAPKKNGKGVKSVKIAGADANNNAYAEVAYGDGSGAASGTVTACYIYKFNKNGKFMGRVRVPESPDMPANRYIHVDAAGSIFYMKADAGSKKIRFYKFMISEMN
jgi:hypothetical protein